MRAAAVVAGFLAVFTAFAVVYTWPLGAHLADAFVLTAAPSWLAHADLLLTSWILSWDCHQLFHDPFRLFQANIFHPLPNALAFSEHLLAGALLVLPIDVVLHDPIVDHNLLVLASFALGGSGAALLIADLGASAPAALAGGILFAFSPLRLAQLGHVHALSTHWTPFALLFLQRSLRTGRWRSAIAFAASLVLAGASSVYCAFYFGLMVALFVVFHALWRCPVAPGAYRRTLVAGALTLLVLAPTLLPYLDVQERFALGSNPQQAIGLSAVGMQYAPAIPWSQPWRSAENGVLRTPLFGLGMLVLAAVGAWGGAGAQRGARRLTALYMSLVLAMALLSLGPVMRMREETIGGVLGPHALLAAIVPGFGGLRVPQRAAAFALLGLSVLAGLGADVLVRRLGGRAARWAGVLVVAAVALAESRRPGLYLLPAPSADAAPAVYRWLARQPEDFAVVELPFETGTIQESVYTLRSAYHWKRLVNGYSRIFPGRTYLENTLNGFPDAQSLRLLRDLDVRSVVVHMPATRGRTSNCEQLLAAGRPHLALAYQDPEACVLDVLSAPPLPDRPPDRPFPLAGVRLTGSMGDDAAAAVDGDVRTHWTQPVDLLHEGWLQIDLPEARPLTRIVLRLGRHFGEHLRAYGVSTSDDGVTWTSVVDTPVAPTPFRAFLTDPDDVTMEIALSGAPVRHLRLVRTPARVWDALLFLDWDHWGVHELELHERPIAPTT
ncbi:MAG: discoidin domain-containing protein [Candidatus Binatia bacterium]